MFTQFKADDYLTQQQDGICSYINDISTKNHFHDYFEFFLVDEGTAKHHINNEIRTVIPGTLCMIRPNDTHYFATPHCNMYNVLLRASVWKQLEEFLGSDVILNSLVSSSMPVHLNLIPEDFEMLTHMLENSILTPHFSAREYNNHIKMVAISLLAKYYEYPLHQNATHPAWFDHLIKEMNQPSNYTEGLDAMYRLSGYTPEYLCRIFKKELGISPSEYINTLRIRAASKMLVYSNDQIIDIAFHCGFNTLSHFYHQFKKVYGCSPYQYKKAHNLQRGEKEE